LFSQGHLSEDDDDAMYPFLMVLTMMIMITVLAMATLKLATVDPDYEQGFELSRRSNIYTYFP
jgi:hypothetical protein